MNEDTKKYVTEGAIILGSSLALVLVWKYVMKPKIVKEIKETITKTENTPTEDNASGKNPSLTYGKMKRAKNMEDNASGAIPSIYRQRRWRYDKNLNPQLLKQVDFEGYQGNRIPSYMYGRTVTSETLKNSH